jgi:hypothetical protein
VGGPADVAEPGSVGDRKRPITEGGDSSPDSDSDESYQYVGVLISLWLFLFHLFLY